MNKTQSQPASLGREGVKLVKCCVRASTGAWEQVVEVERTRTVPKDLKNHRS